MNIVRMQNRLVRFRSGRDHRVLQLCAAILHFHHASPCYAQDISLLTALSSQYRAF
jgi:hypothetical protein